MSGRMIYHRFRRKLCHLRGDKRGLARWTHVMNSQAALRALKRSFDPNAVPMVQVEITTECNYKCPFCAHAKSDRPVRYISRGDFGLLMEKLKRIHFSSSIVLDVVNEPFMHPDLLSFCKIISVELPQADLGLITNGALVREDHIRFLAGLERPPLLIVDDYTPSQEITRRLKEWLGPYSKTGFGERVTFFKRSWDEKLSDFAGNARGCGSDMEDYQDVVCTWPFVSVFVDAELNTFLCCFDYHHSIITGNLKTQGLMEIWKSQPYLDLRHKMLTSQRRELSLCRGCDAVSFGLPAHCK
jgi:MoaA/NifB/PqqE/SkfB family radical SAM enzyme